MNNVGSHPDGSVSTVITARTLLLRGGCYLNELNMTECRSTCRDHGWRWGRDDIAGFRPALTLESQDGLSVGALSMAGLIKPQAKTPPLEEFDLDLKAPDKFHKLWKGKWVDWYATKGSVVEEVPARYLTIFVGNIMDPNKLSGLYWALKDRIQAGKRSRFIMPFGYRSKIGLVQIQESLEAEKANRLDELGLDEAWTTGDEQVDEYLADPEAYVEKYGDDVIDPDSVEGTMATIHKLQKAEIQRQMNARIEVLVAAGSGDLGKTEVQLRDGHHRMFATLATGEPTVFVRIIEG